MKIFQGKIQDKNVIRISPGMLEWLIYIEFCFGDIGL